MPNSFKHPPNSPPDLPKNWAVALFPAFDPIDVFGTLDPLYYLAFSRQLNLALISETLDPVWVQPPTPALNHQNSSFWYSVSIPPHLSHLPMNSGCLDVNRTRSIQHTPTPTRPQTLKSCSCPAAEASDCSISRRKSTSCALRIPRSSICSLYAPARAYLLKQVCWTGARRRRIRKPGARLQRWAQRCSGKVRRGGLWMGIFGRVAG